MLAIVVLSGVAQDSIQLCDLQFFTLNGAACGFSLHLMPCASQGAMRLTGRSLLAAATAEGDDAHSQVKLYSLTH